MFLFGRAICLVNSWWCNMAIAQQGVKVACLSGLGEMREGWENYKRPSSVWGLWFFQSILNLSVLYSEQKRQHSLGRKSFFNSTAFKLERSLAFREYSALEGNCNSRIIWMFILSKFNSINAFNIHFLVCHRKYFSTWEVFGAIFFFSAWNKITSWTDRLPGHLHGTVVILNTE